MVVSRASSNSSPSSTGNLPAARSAMRRSKTGLVWATGNVPSVSSAACFSSMVRVFTTSANCATIWGLGMLVLPIRSSAATRTDLSASAKAVSMAWLICLSFSAAKARRLSARMSAAGSVFSRSSSTELADARPSLLMARMALRRIDGSAWVASAVYRPADPVFRAAALRTTGPR